MARLRVLFIVHGLWRGGAETQLAKLVNMLPVDRFRKFMFSYRVGDDLRNDIDTEQVVLFHAAKKGRLDLALARHIGRLIDEHEIDVVHCTMRNAMLFGYLAIRFASRSPKLVVALHSTHNATFSMNVADVLVYRRVLRRCDRVWFVSTPQSEVWTRRMPFLADKSIVIHNGVDLTKFDPDNARRAGIELRQSLNIPAGSRVLSCVAGFRAVKLHSVLFDAFSKLVADGQTYHLLLAGSGRLEQSLRDQARALGLENRIHFLGVLSDVRPVLAASDCMVLASESETLSMAMLEAMAMRLPVITTVVGGASEAIEDGQSGFLVRPRDVDQLVSRIKETLEDDARRESMGRSARRIVEQRFSETKMLSDSAAALLAVAARA